MMVAKTHCRRAWSLLFGPVAALRGDFVVATVNLYGDNLETATGVRVRSSDGRVHSAKIVASVLRHAVANSPTSVPQQTWRACCKLPLARL